MGVMCDLSFLYDINVVEHWHLGNNLPEMFLAQGAFKRSRRSSKYNH